MTETIHTLILDRNPSSNASRSLQALLAGLAETSCVVHLCSVSFSSAPLASAGGFMGFIAQVKPQIVFIVVGPDQIELAWLLISVRRTGLALPPVVVVDEGCFVCNINELFALGSAERLSLPVSTREFRACIRKAMERHKPRLSAARCASEMARIPANDRFPDR